LYNGEGIPASPFRRDGRPFFDPDRDKAVSIGKLKEPKGYQLKDWIRLRMRQ